MHCYLHNAFCISPEQNNMKFFNLGLQPLYCLHPAFLQTKPNLSYL